MEVFITIAIHTFELHTCLSHTKRTVLAYNFILYYLLKDCFESVIILEFDFVIFNLDYI